MASEADIQRMLENFERYLAGMDLKEKLTDAIYNEIAEAITGITREEALEIASQRAAEMVTNIEEQMRQQMRHAIEQGLEQQVGVDGLARMLEDGLTLDTNRQKTLDAYQQELYQRGIPFGSPEYDRLMASKTAELVADRARTIAATEMRSAIEQAEQQVAKNRKATHKLWLTVADDNVCQVCRANEAQGVIEIEEKFQSGHQTAPAHPKCRCTVTYVTDTGNGELDFFQEFAKEQAALTEQARGEG